MKRKIKQKVTDQLLFRINENSSERNASSCATADLKHLVVKVTHLVQALFHEIMKSAIFVCLNTIYKLLSHEFILVNHSYN